MKKFKRLKIKPYYETMAMKLAKEKRTFIDQNSES